ncbi:MAG: hypothetical protein J07HX64_01727 [halophilic archaeon J07HX64]|jgi:Predicted exporters of the RND superfamily|nr:MAG: hypothetical protein J07HX64_01727 [halophilic archaeon J07HX64]
MLLNALTRPLVALTVGPGIADSIDISTRYESGFRRQENIWTAPGTAVTGTAGALPGSAVTSIGGFGTVLVDILPALQQFGTIAALTIVCASLGTVLVLHSIPVPWSGLSGLGTVPRRRG